jgi:hypothetical protein
LLFLLAVLGFAIWLNGPGLRWLGPRIAEHYLEKAGLNASFVLHGSITGGIEIRQLALNGKGSLSSIKVGRIAPDYQFRELWQGRLGGVEIENAHAEIQLGAETESASGDSTSAFESEPLVQTIRSLREKAIATTVSLKGISINASREGKPVVALAPSSLLHQAGESGFELDLGAITDGQGRVWPAQQSVIMWNADDIRIDRLDPLPALRIRELVVKTPASGGISAETQVLVEGATLMVEASPGLSSLRVDLREGRLASRVLAERYGFDLPASGELTSLSVQVDNLLPDPMMATGAIRLLLENIEFEEWKVPELSVDLGLEKENASLAASGNALGTGFNINAAGPITRDSSGLRPGEISGRFNVAEVSRVIAALSDKVKLLDPAVPVPASMVDGGFRVAFDELKPAAADVNLVLKPADPAAASSLAIDAKWFVDSPIEADLQLEGMTATGEYDTAKSSYRGNVVLEDFKSGRIDPWLALVRASTESALGVSGVWTGGGLLKEGKHHGELSLSSLDYARGTSPAIKGKAHVNYQWPDGFEAKDISVQTQDQTISSQARMAGGFLELNQLQWRHRDQEMAGGSAKLPVPEDFGKWREMIASDPRAVELSLDTKVLSLAVLKDWIPATTQLDAQSTGQLSVNLRGTYSKPDVQVTIEAKNLRSPDQPKLPPAGLKLTLAGKDGHLAVVGSVVMPDFQPAVIQASMPFRPSEWIEDPKLIQTEKFISRVDLPRVDLARFASLVPAARRIEGVITGNVEAAGEVGSPAIKGKLELSGGRVEMKDQNIPEITGIGLAVDLALDKITLRGLKGELAGGSISGGGTLTLDAGKPGVLDFRVRGDHLPVARNDSLIVRSNADLRLSGPWQTAALSGSLGIIDSLFYRDIEILPMGTPFTGPSAAALPKLDAPANPAQSIPEPFRNWTLNLRARTENSFLIRGNIASGRIDGDVRIGGTLGNPAPDGEVRITNLRASLPFSTLTVKSGLLRFSPATGMDPILEIRGTAEPRPYRVNAYVYGRASNPQLVLTSNPPLPENEIMTLLATGTTTAGLEDPQMASTRAMQLLAEELRRGRFAVGRQLRPLLGLLDRVDFSIAEADPYTSESFSTATLAVTDRWFVSAGMGGEGDSRVLAIWRLSFH